MHTRSAQFQPSASNARIAGTSKSRLLWFRELTILYLDPSGVATKCFRKEIQ